MHFRSCPISSESIDASALRTASLFLAILVGCYIVNQNILLMVFIFTELAIRLLFKPSNAPLFRLGTFTARLLEIKSVYEDAAPKKFAAKIGLLFSLLISALHFLSPPVATVFSIIFLVCILAELLFGYCVGCEIYYQTSRLRRLYAKNHS